MKILFLHGWQSVVGGVKPTYLAAQGHEVINPKLPDEDFAEAVRIAQVAFDLHQPQVIVGSSRGGAVAMNLRSRDARLVLLCPAWRKWGTAQAVRADAVILHSRADEVIPFTDSEALAAGSGARLIEVGSDHRLADPEPLTSMLEACEAVAPKFWGIDFGAPKRAGDQAKKIIALEAIQVAPRHYAVRATGSNVRLSRWRPGSRNWPDDRPGWTLPALREKLIADRSLEVLAFDFPFSLPLSLLDLLEFAQRMDHPIAFGTRQHWAEFVAARLRLEFTSDRSNGEMADFVRFENWRDTMLWHRRACDVATRGSPPLKHIGQNLFSMTLAGAALLQAVQSHGFEILLGERPREKRRLLFETYPSLVARRIGFRGSYKAEPVCCLSTAVSYLQQQGIQLDFATEVRQFCDRYRTGPKRDDPDGADAFLCLVTAICFREGLADIEYGTANLAQRAEEGGIVAPRPIT